ncbi:Crp/Fnr family transcriptional regulator [Microvirga sp. SRT01]|uniref:Crp/Fnr family transcriptional regulator n=1 Tax=Sphingomonas longa TaxID=2778730 RepID=A0ABS2D785_9SPHN|nr:Crp/Fnr family transcriptional regulator [Microvirga sp. SRT01]MBM6576792.1 Crp/Fnr family transcriptional regulator [Sphingomonas sp. BT552]MBR7709837.1 Crp/Fnr family transcriptional regulator [Microvirga sp. SRT01]
MSDVAAIVVRKLEMRARLSAADRTAVAAMVVQHRQYEAGSYLVREGEPPRPTCAFIISGIAYRQKLTREGARQIVALEMQGDFIDVQHLFLRCADHNVQSLTRMETAEVSREGLRQLALTHPAIGEALWVDALVAGSVYREWITNLGRRDAKTRVAHLLCEFTLRARAAGIAGHLQYELPMTQEQLGDATGLTSVHVNRTLKALEVDGLIARDRRHVRLIDWDRIVDVADFNSRYLHLDQVGAE